jgi:hypothetical protein
MVDIGVMLVTQKSVALQLAAYQRLYLNKRMLLLCLQARYSCYNSALPHENVDKQLEF